MVTPLVDAEVVLGAYGKPPMVNWILDVLTLVRVSLMTKVTLMFVTELTKVWLAGDSLLPAGAVLSILIEIISELFKFPRVSFA